MTLPTIVDTSGLGIELVPEPAKIIMRGRSDNLTLMRFANDEPLADIHKAIPEQDAFDIILPLAPMHYEYWWEGERGVQQSDPLSSFNVFDLNLAPTCRMIGPFDKLHLYVPRAALDDIADDARSPPIERLVAPDGWNTVDPVVDGIKRILLLAFERPEEVSGLFVDHVMMALQIHLSRTYGGMRDGARRSLGGLAPWQLRRARELIAGNLHGELSLVDIAQHCGLSASHFARAFKASAGMTPHQWLQTCRVDLARTMLDRPETPLPDIALVCGFADQSHMSRVFARALGNTPGAWRRVRLKPTA